MEFDGLKHKGIRIVIDIDPTALFPSDPFTVEEVGPIPAQVIDLIAKYLPNGWIATATVKAKL